MLDNYIWTFVLDDESVCVENKHTEQFKRNIQTNIQRVNATAHLLSAMIGKQEVDIRFILHYKYQINPTYK